jgi:hypothetical protein
LASGSTRTARRPTATRRRARLRWPPSLRANGGNDDTYGCSPGAGKSLIVGARAVHRR